jgi:hypothetical protein
MKNAEAVKQRNIQRLAQQSILWEQVSSTVSDPNKYFLYFADEQNRTAGMLLLRKLFPDVKTNVSAEGSDADIHYSSDEKGGKAHPTIKIPVEVADSLREVYKTSERLVNASPARGGVRLSDTCPGEHALGVLSKLEDNISLVG